MSQDYRPQRLLVYVLSSDDGLAPNITGGICSLTVCKPVVRRAATVGQDWIIGMSTTKHGKNRIIYAMQVDEKLPYEAFFTDPRFACKKPTTQNPNGDNFFCQTANGLEIATHTAAHAGKDDKIKRDLNAPVAVLGQRFWYFGANAPELPPHLCETRVVQGNRRGHRVIDDAAVVNALANWLEANYAPDVYGPPRDRA